MKKLLTISLLLGLASFALIGCATESEPEGYKQDNFKKTDPPPGWGAGGGSTGGGNAPAADPNKAPTAPAGESGN